MGDRLREHGKMGSYTSTLTARINWFLRVKPQYVMEKNNLLIKMLEQHKKPGFHSRGTSIFSVNSP